MRIEPRKAMQIIDNLSARMRENGSSDDLILDLNLIIRDFGIDKQHIGISRLLDGLERQPDNEPVANILVHKVKKVLAFHSRKRNQFIVEPTEGDFNGEIPIARCGSINYTTTPEELCLNLLVCGSIGSGKSTLLYNLARALNRVGIPWVWVDTSKKSGRNLISDFPNTLVIQFKLDSQFKWNLMKAPPGVEMQKWRSAFGEALSTATEAYIGTRSFFFKHLTKVMASKNAYFDLLYQSVVNDKLSYYKNPREFAQRDSAIFRLRVINNEVGPVLNCLESYPIFQMLRDGFNIVVEIIAPSPDVKMFCAEAVFAYIGCYIKEHPNPEKTLKYFMFMDEANDIFGIRTKGKNQVLLDLIRTMRSGGCGVGFGCQQICGLEDEILQNVHSRIMLPMSSGDDIFKMARCMMFSEEQIESIPRLQKLNGIVRTPAFPELFRITIDPYFLPDVSDEEVFRNNERILSNYSYVPLPSDVLEIRDEIPRIDVDANKGKEEEESTNETVEKEIKDTEIQPTDYEKKLLVDIYTRPFESVNFKNRSLGYSGSVGFKVKKSLIDKGYVAEYPIKLGENRGKRGKILILQDKSEQVIDNAPKSFYGRGASLHHSFVQHLLKLHIENLWHLKAEMEMVRNGKSVDIGIITNDGSFIAVEFENTSVHARENIVKDLAAGFEKVITVCNKQDVLEKIKAIVDEELSDKKGKVVICLLKDVLMGAIEI